MATDAAVTATLDAFLRQIDKHVEFDASTPLFADGLRLDSLETAELSATLEDEFDTDPFSAAADMPQTVGAILAFYASAPADA